MKYFRTFLLNLDALGGGLIYGAPPGMYISTWVGLKYPNGKMDRFIKWLFQDANHCVNSIHSQWELVQKYYR